MVGGADVGEDGAEVGEGKVAALPEKVRATMQDRLVGLMGDVVNSSSSATSSASVTLARLRQLDDARVGLLTKGCVSRSTLVAAEVEEEDEEDEDEEGEEGEKEAEEEEEGGKETMVEADAKLALALETLMDLEDSSDGASNNRYNIQCSEIFTLRNEKIHTET